MATRNVPPVFGAGVGAPPAATGVRPLLPLDPPVADTLGWLVALGVAGVTGAQAASRAEPAPRLIRRNAVRRVVSATDWA
jgi:hypothetical protein